MHFHCSKLRPEETQEASYTASVTYLARLKISLETVLNCKFVTVTAGQLSVTAFFASLHQGEGGDAASRGGGDP
jgi:hypothetical protein